MEKIRDEKYGDADGRRGRGLTLHIAPSNMPTMFAYSWITSLLAGSSAVVRLSERSSVVTEAALRGIAEVLNRPEFAELRRQNAFVSFPRGSRALEEISQKAKARVIWGGDETVESISGVPKGTGCADMAFPDKYSAALFRVSDFRNLDDKELGRLAHLFYNDTYGADQNACSSPRTIFWLDEEQAGDAGEIKEKWWAAFAKEAENYDLQPWIATEKYRLLCRTYAARKGLGTALRTGNRLYRVPVANDGRSLTDLEAKFGMFYEMDIESLDEMTPYMEEKIQTIVSSGSNQDLIYEKMRSAGCEGVDRVVAMGEALDFSTTWDRKDLVEMLSCTSLNGTTNT
ncbi:MAG: acyl-CoA reductase [Bacillota bacterium]